MTRRDPFANCADASHLPDCVLCISYCPMKTPWKNDEGKLVMKCGKERAHKSAPSSGQNLEP